MSNLIRNQPSQPTLPEVQCTIELSPAPAMTPPTHRVTAVDNIRLGRKVQQFPRIPYLPQRCQQISKPGICDLLPASPVQGVKPTEVTAHERRICRLLAGHTESLGKHRYPDSGINEGQEALGASALVGHQEFNISLSKGHLEHLSRSVP